MKFEDTYVKLGGKVENLYQNNNSSKFNIPWMHGLMGVLGCAAMAGLILFLVRKRQR